MRLHRLELQAFGPFPGHEAVDFDALDHGILLVNGPTGSGKTSLLDAVAFALFGDVPGSRRALRQSLRSHHAAPHVAPWVRLEFSTGSTRWKVERSPQWDAPKKRGSGTTSRPASVVLSQWRDGQWYAVSQRIDEAAEMISQILGMGLDQFAQVVLLPQGEFAQFLRARPEDRRVLLERLFDVARFEHVEGWLTEQKNDRARTRDESLHLIQAHLTVVDDAVSRLPGEPLGMPDWDVVSIPDLPERMRILLTEVREQHESARQVDADASGAARRAERMREAATERAADVVRHRRAVADLEMWPLDEVAAMKRRADDAGQVAGVLRLAGRADTLDAEARTARDRVQHLEAQRSDVLLAAQVPAPGQDVPGSGPDAPDSAEDSGGADGTDDTDGVFAPEALEATVDALRRGDATLELCIDAHRAQQRAMDALESATAALTRERHELAQQEELLAAAVQDQDDAVAARDGLPDPTGAIQAAAALRATLRLVPERRRAVETSRTTAREATRAFAAAEAAVLALRQTRLAGITGEIAEQLVTGEPCPVCGSRSHPEPAEPGSDAVSAEDIETAQRRSEDVDTHRLRALSELARAEEAWQGLIDTVDERRALLIETGAALPSVTTHPENAEVVATESESFPTERVVPPTAALIEDPEPVDAVAQQLEAAAERRREAEHRVTAAGTQVEGRRDQVAAAAAALAAATAACDAAKERFAETSSARTQADESWAQISRDLRKTRPIPVKLLVLTPDTDEPGDGGDAAPGTPAETSRPDARAAANRTALSTAVAQYRRLAAICTELRSARREAAAAEERATAAAQELEDDLVAKGFDDREQAEAVAMPDAELADLRERWQTAIEVRAAAQAVLRDPDILSAAYTPTDDPGRLDRRVDILTRRATEASSLLARWSTAASTLDGMRHRLADAVRDYLPRARAADEMAELAATFSGTGENTRRMRLTSYVLAAHLETVTAMANERLARMSDGRYQLQYTDERARGNQRSGLGITVLDAWTGLSRDTATLSGGEAFMASLALALGLGDAVRADSGGMELNTLFVDEGFGSLDQETLEEVMGVLDGLREGGRLVGVVSHVTELRARIPTHIEIRKTSDGSTVHARQMAGDLNSSPE